MVNHFSNDHIIGGANFSKKLPRPILQDKPIGLVLDSSSYPTFSCQVLNWRPVKTFHLVSVTVFHRIPKFCVQLMMQKCSNLPFCLSLLTGRWIVVQWLLGYSHANYFISHGKNYSILCNRIGLNQYMVYDSSRELNHAVLSQLPDSRFGVDLESSVFSRFWWKGVSLHTHTSYLLFQGIPLWLFRYLFSCLLFCKYEKKIEILPLLFHAFIIAMLIQLFQ